jgi:hypothetical protein
VPIYETTRHQTLSDSNPYSNGILFIAIKIVAVKEINAIPVSGQADNFSLLVDAVSFISCEQRCTE